MLCIEKPQPVVSHVVNNRKLRGLGLGKLGNLTTTE